MNLWAVCVACGLSALRIGIAPVLAVGIIHGWNPLGLALSIAASMGTDMLDGWVARRFQGQTQGGAYLDAAADKIFVGAILGALAWTRMLPWELVALCAVRDVSLLVGSLWMHRQRLPIAAPVWISKINTCLQCAVAITALCAYGPMTNSSGFLHRVSAFCAYLFTPLASIMGGMTVASGWIYAFKAYRTWQRNRNS